MRGNLRVTNWREGLGTMTEERAWTTFAENVRRTMCLQGREGISADPMDEHRNTEGNAEEEKNVE
jgi:hypothetical protein